MQRRVLFMISSMRGGGSEQQTLLLLKHLDRSRFKPHLFLLDQEGEWMSQIPDDVAIHSYREESTNGIYFPGRALRAQTKQLRRILERESIDVVYDRTFHMTMIAGPACNSLAIPRVSTIVSPPDQALPMVESRFVALKRRQLAKAYRQSQTVVAVSHAAAKSARSYYGLPANHVTVIHNGVDRDAIVESSSQATVSQNDKLTLVCVGRMTEEKGHSDLIKALAALPSGHAPVQLRMIGDGPLKMELQREATESCAQHEVDFIGIVTNPAPYIAASDALVLPSRFEGMPNVVLEAMALGTPVIATRAGGTVELERDQPTILWCNPNDWSSLAGAIESFASDRESACARAIAAKQLITDHHDVKSMTKKIEQLLN
jgi:glycosyltransferase involved in cell wall biosynthesis